MSENYDVIIIGAGPAGLTSALYTSRAGLRTVLLEKEMFGGALMNRDLLEDYPGYSEILGPDLASQMLDQATQFGAELEMGTVEEIRTDGAQKVVKTDTGEFTGKTVILTGGSHAESLGIPGEEELEGKGVIHCASCDGPLYKEQVVAVVGGGNDAVYEALSLAKYATKVFLVHSGDKLQADGFLSERASAEAKIEFVRDTNVTAVLGEDGVTGIQINNAQTRESSKLDVYGVCIAVGSKPNTDIVGGVMKLADNGAIPVGRNMETEIPGVFAAGNIREGSSMRIASAVGDGSTAAMAAENYLNASRK